MRDCMDGPNCQERERVKKKKKRKKNENHLQRPGNSDFVAYSLVTDISVNSYFNANSLVIGVWK